MSFLIKIFNAIAHSKIGYYFWELKYKFAFKYIHWLLKRNGIDAPTGTDVLWHYLLGKLTDKASSKGIGVKHLYIIKNRFFKIRGFTLISVMKDDDSIKNFCNLNAREAYHVLGGLIQLPILNASNWNSATREEKQKLFRNLENNAYKLWSEIKHSCKNLNIQWKSDKNLPFNVGMQAFTILGAVFFSIKSLPEELFSLIETFEHIWGNPQNFNATELYNNVKNFEAISQELFAQRRNTNLDNNDLLATLFESHKDRIANLSSPENINIAAYFTFFENIPKAMLGMFSLVFSNEHWSEILCAERLRLKSCLTEMNISSKSEDAFNYILNHSEIFDRFYMEILRCWSVAPVLPRINSNLFFNKLFNWGDSMRISEEHTLPTRSIAILSQFKHTISEKWTAPTEFNPFRNEYQFKTNIKGQSYSAGEKPLVQGAASSYRGCPARKFTRAYFYSMLWWFPKYNKINLTEKEQSRLLKPPPLATFYRPLSTPTTRKVRGQLS